MEAASRHLGKSSQRLRGKVFYPIGFVPELSCPPFPLEAGQYVQCKCIIKYVGITLGQR